MKYKKQKTSHAGFTLLELLITISIASILLTMSIVSFNALSQQYQIKNTLHHLSLSYNRARIYAIQNKTNVYVVQNQNESWASGWNVFVDYNNNFVFDPIVDETIDSFKNIPKSIEQGFSNINCIIFTKTGITRRCDKGSGANLIGNHSISFKSINDNICGYSLRLIFNRNHARICQEKLDSKSKICACS
jgi:type IV fimbrial biogenesis protein FimT